MKDIRKIAILLFFTAFFASCSDWLDVTPFDALDKEKIFENERNTNAALNGIYLMLTNDNLYGKELSAGMLEVLGQNFSVPEISGDYEHPYYQLSQYNYNADYPKAKLSYVFITAYQAIANCNEFLESLDTNKALFTEDKYNLYKGEVIAIRTLIHFDMMRLFGPIGSQLSKKSVPYYNVSTDTPKQILPADELLDILMADMDIAIKLLEKDPVLSTGLNSTSNKTDVDFFTSFRNMRMNYYAANAIKARICLYKGTEESKAAAYRIASGLLEGKDPLDPAKATNFNDTFSFVKNGDSEAISTIFYPEILFGIHNIKRAEVHRSLFSNDLSNSEILTGGTGFWTRLYSSGIAGNDGNGTGVRRNMWTFDGIKKGYLFTRLSVESFAHYPYHHQFQGIMRLGELYLIAAETAPSLEVKRSWLEAMRNGKGYDPGNVDGLSSEQLDNVTEFELRKDTYGEGQYFFYVKRRALAAFYNQKNALTYMTASSYVPPLPDVETDYRSEGEENPASR